MDQPWWREKKGQGRDREEERREITEEMNGGEG